MSEEPKKTYNHLLDVAFSIETPIQDTLEIPPEDIIEALQNRVDYLRNHMTEVGSAIGDIGCYEVKIE